MDSQAQMHRSHARHQTEEPIKINHPEEGEHHEKGPSKVLKKVKEKAKKIKNVLTKHGHSHEHDRGAHIPDDHDIDEEDDEDVYPDQKVHGGAPARGKAHNPVKEEIIPPGTKAFPVYSQTKHSEPSRGVGSGVSEKEERRGTSTLTPHNTPASLPSATEDVKRTFVHGEDKSRDNRRVNIERPKGLEQDPAAPGSHGHGGMSNYQSKVTDPTKKATGEIGAASTVSALGRLGLGTDFGGKAHGHGPGTKSAHGGMSNYQSKATDPAGKGGEIGEHPSVAAFGGRKEPAKDDQLGFGRHIPEKSHGFDTKLGHETGKHVPAGNYGSGLSDEFDSGEHFHGPGTKSTAPGSHGGMSYYQSKVTGHAGKATGGIGEQPSVTAFGRRKEPGEDDQLGLGRNIPEKSHGFDTKLGPGMGKHEDYGSGLRKGSPGRHEFDSGKDFQTKRHEEGDAIQHPDQSSYTDKIASASAVVADKAVAAKNAVASKLGYSGEATDQTRVEGAETPSSGGGYGSKVTSMVTPVYEKAKETGANVVSKLPFTGTGTLTGTGTGTEQGQDKGVSTREYLTEKLSPGEEDKVLSQVVAEKLHLGGGETEVKKGRVTQSEEVEKRLGGFKEPSSEAEMKHGKEYAEEGEGGMAEKLAGAVSSWFAGTTEEVTQKSTESVQDSSVSLGSTVGNKIGMSGPGGDGAGQRHGNNDDVPLQGRFQGSGN